MQAIVGKRVLSGIQPTGVPTLGNYLGALVNWVKLQGPDPATGTPRVVLYSIVDLHAITVEHDPAALRQNCRDMAAALLACGVNPRLSTLFRQGKVAEHTELGWILSCTTPLGWLKRMTQFKTKGKNQDQASLGLLAYPVLQAADILLYQADRTVAKPGALPHFTTVCTVVPVGDDQRQHLELTRDVALSFNAKYGEVFNIPDGLFGSAGQARIMSLRDATSKMSKSDKSDNSRINLTDSSSLIATKIRKAHSDALDYISYEPEKRPEVANLINILAAVTDRSTDDVVDDFKTCTSIATFKSAVADAVIARVVPIGEEMSRLRSDPGYLEDVLRDGEARASAIAKDTMIKVKEAIGLP